MKDKIALLPIINKNSNNFHIIEAILNAFNGLHDVNAILVDLMTVYNTLELEKPSILLIVGSTIAEKCDYISLGAYLRSRSIKYVFWSTDDPYEIDASMSIVDLFDLFLTSDRSSYLFFNKKNVAHMPLAADHRYYDDSTAENIHKTLFFCGAPFSNRKQIISDIYNEISSKSYAQDFSLLLSESDWGLPESSQIKYIKINDRNLLLKCYRSSWASIYLGRSYNLANKNKVVASTPGPRFFEAAMVGAFQLYINNSLEIEKYFKPNYHYTHLHNLSNLSKVLTIPINKRNKLAYDASRHCLKFHTYSHRLKKIISILQG